MEQFKHFIERIQHLKNQTMPPLLLDCIQQADLMAIVDDLLTNKQRQSRYKKLQPNQAIRISKESKGLKCTFCVLRTPDGEYRCILETKSKSANDTKRKIEKVNGTNKYGKPSWRLDGKNGPQEYISLVKVVHPNVKKINPKNKAVAKKLEEIKREVEFPWTFAKKSGLQRTALGAVYTNKKGGMISIYSKKGIPLDKLENHKITLTEEEKNDVAVSLLKTTALLHENQVIYQDIKPANILLFNKPSDGSKKVKLIDPGSVFKPGMPPSTQCLATYPYESPEISLAQTNSGADYFHYFKNHYAKSGPSLASPIANYLYNRLSTLGDEKHELATKQLLKPHPANDLWALGVTLSWLFNNQLPNKIPTEPHFAGFFEARPQRFTAAQALTMWSNKKIKI